MRAAGIMKVTGKDNMAGLSTITAGTSIASGIIMNTTGTMIVTMITGKTDLSNHPNQRPPEGGL
jgi:hypothetical protein